MKITTPIVDFVKQYTTSNPSRFHMPGHKGTPLLGPEPFDITEIAGADVLSAPNGIIAQSEAQATSLFGTAHTYYVTEGSTQAIKAMLALVAQNVPRHRKARILAARNAHKAFVYAAALLDLEVIWLFPAAHEHLCSCRLSADDIAKAIDAMPDPPDAVYLTSPDYLGQLADIKSIAAICRARKVPLLVDNAHGAYLRFLTPSRHPITLGATMCCDSAHKTLPALTGAAYLHLAPTATAYLPNVRAALALFGSTSPSYLVLQSLDLVNRELAAYAEPLTACVKTVTTVKNALMAKGIPLLDTEPLKIVIDANRLGYTGETVADHLRSHHIEPEFADREVVVLMVTLMTSDNDYRRLLAAMDALPPKAPLTTPSISPLTAVSAACSIRDALLAKQTVLPIAQALGRICAAPTVSCPPAVPIVISGEVITEEAIRLFAHYGIDTIAVMEDMIAR